MALFKEFPLSPPVQQALADMGFIELTEVQEKALPLMLAGKDVMAKAPTGTGKTAAFGLPMVESLTGEEKETGALILCPTRELCRQITSDLQRYAAHKPGVKIVPVYGGESIGKQANLLTQKPQIVVATPGRLMDHMRRKSVDLRQVKIVILDEADEMLDMGFYKDVVGILDKLPAKQQMGLFSATWSREVMDISWLYQKDPVEIVVEPKEKSQPKIVQYYLESTGRQRLWDLVALFRQRGYQKAMVFCNTRYAAQALSDQLRQQGIKATPLHGDLTQKSRNEVMGAFRGNDTDVLVATDVAARGLDIFGVDAVFNYEIPSENAYYVHRIGRTGRAGKEGEAFTFYSASERIRLRTLLQKVRQEATALQVSEEGVFSPDPDFRL